MPVITVKNLCKTYSSDTAPVHAVKNVSFSIAEGGIVAVMGSSGSGKSTLLYMLGGLEQPTNGEITVDGVSIRTLNAPSLAAYRRNMVGFIYQNYRLLPSLSVYDNITLPAALDGKTPSKESVLELLSLLGIEDKAFTYPDRLSGGQQQRAAIARALIHSPKIVLADEPTGNLDSKNGKEIIELLVEVCKKYRRTLLTVTHDPTVAAYADRILHMKDGKLTEARGV